ncbi:hypothetical protein FQZ97_1004520 [compost metagenome]
MDGGPGAGRGGGKGQRRGDHHQPWRGDVGEVVEAEHLVVQPEHQLPDDHAQAQPHHHAQAGNHHGELDVVPGDGPVAVAQRLERGDLAALRGHLAAQHHVEDEHGHGQEDRGQHRAHHLELRELVGDDLGRELFVATHRAQRAVGVEQAIGLLDHGGL